MNTNFQTYTYTHTERLYSTHYHVATNVYIYIRVHT